MDIQDKLNSIAKHTPYVIDHVVFEAIGMDGVRGCITNAAAKIVDLIEAEDDEALGRMLREQAEIYLTTY